MKRQDILFLVGYHNRANAKIFDTAAQLTDEQLMRDNEFDLGTAFQPLRHLWMWIGAGGNFAVATTLARPTCGTLRQ